MDSHLSQAKSMAYDTTTWKHGADNRKHFCDLRDLEGKSGKNWEFSQEEARVLQCASRSPEGEVSDKASIRLDGTITSIAEQWLPDFGEHGHRRAVDACAERDKEFPVIMHFITPKE